jgi:hypothetical protein
MTLSASFKLPGRVSGMAGIGRIGVGINLAIIA